MTDDTNSRLPAPKLPTTVEDLLIQRRVLRQRTLNDDVEDCHLGLWDNNPEYQQYFQAIWKEETVEGSFVDDDSSAAKMVREYAAEHNRPLAAKAKLAAIRRSLHVVCRRYDMSRNQRRELIGGNPPPKPHNNKRDSATIDLEFEAEAAE